LIFDETDDNVNDIYHCNEFETNEAIAEKENLIYIDIKEDEKADFEPSIDFLIKNQQCKFAYEELIQYQNNIIAKELYLAWLDKFYSLFKSFDLPPFYYRAYDEFYKLYDNLNYLNDFFKFEDIAKEALLDFKNLSLDEEIDLLRWLVKYEECGQNLNLFLYEDIDLEYPENKDYFIIENITISTSDIHHLAKFKFIFDKYYNSMLDIYTTFSEEEIAKHINENTELSDMIFMLSFHLKRRGINLG
jgi:hypothetical protein